MPYLMIEDFASGVDRRKSAETAPAGSLRTLTNAVITAGGEIEKRRRLTQLGQLPLNQTKGLSFDGQNLLVFGTLSPAPASLPDYVSYQVLVPVGGGVTISAVLDTQIFASKHYVIARMSDGSIRHFYDGAEVTDASAQGTTVYPHKAKLYATDGPNLRFSAVRDASDWSTGAGAGIIDVTEEDSAVGDLVGVSQYYSSLALFGRTSVQIWAMDPDPALNQQIQALGNTGLLAPHGLARYGNGDVLFLSNTGVRSLRARDASNAAALNDVGAPIDALIADRRGLLTPDVAEKVRAVVDPLTGRFVLVWGSEAFVLSTFPNSKVSAWSVFDFGVEIDDVVQANSRLAFRAGENILLYGATPQQGVNPFDPDNLTGNDVENFDDTLVTVETPFLDANDPAANKLWNGLDVSVRGTWDVYINPDLDETAAWVKVATVGSSTWSTGRIPLEVQSTHLAVRMVSRNFGPSSVASMALHYDDGEKS